jgi:hypothetical protein
MARALILDSGQSLACEVPSPVCRQDFEIFNKFVRIILTKQSGEIVMRIAREMVSETFLAIALTGYAALCAILLELAFSH